MRVLGVETSCDETAAAVVAETGDPARPWAIESNVVASQVAIHREWGGVVPELASRQHLRDICGVVDRALADAGVGWRQLEAVAVTQGPGLVGSLLVGVAFAKTLAWVLGRPLVAVHHLAGHIESLVLQNGELALPAVVLVVSGGHTSLYVVPAPGDYRLIGRTRDDAAGEAYDKVAKLLGLGYPGGPILDRLAKEGDEAAVALPKPRLSGPHPLPPEAAPPSAFGSVIAGRFDFSFSGLKTAVARYVQARRAALGLEASEPLPHREMADIAASFQRIVVETLLDRTFQAVRWFDARSIGIAGGVAANSRLRADAAARAAAAGRPLYLPSLALATDNAAMIAAAGLRRLRAGRTAEWTLNADPALPLS
jgi:N6-L-threonylcarbamoyladenine synthase